MPELSTEFEQLYQDLVEHITANSITVDFPRVRAAFELAVSAHEGQKRRDGSPYVTHTVKAAEITADMGLDEDSSSNSNSRPHRRWISEPSKTSWSLIQSMACSA